MKTKLPLRGSDIKNVWIISRDQLHLGVIRDLERQQRRKAENVYVLEQQIELTKALQKQNTAPPLRQLEEKT